LLKKLCYFYVLTFIISSNNNIRETPFTFTLGILNKDIKFENDPGLRQIISGNKIL
jgi:hypothetical protein